MNRPRYRQYLLLVLTVILLFNSLDRVAMGLMLEDIKRDLGLSDTQLGFTTGIAFALFYSVMGLPIARWADRGNRVGIIAFTAAVWSVAVAMCGLAMSFVQLLMLRVAVAIGEAGCMPPSYSLISHYFSRAERPRAAALFSLGGTLSTVIGFFAAGWLTQRYGWRVTFVALGIPGIFVALIAWFTLEEPRREKSATSPGAITAAARVAQPKLADVCLTLWHNVTFRSLLLSLSVILFFSYGVFVWLPAFLSRSFHLTSAEAGIWLALTYGIGGTLGAYVGGELASRLAPNNETQQLKLMALAIAAAGLLAVVAYLASNPYLAVISIGLSAMGVTTVNGPLFSTLQSLVPEEIRAVSIALVYLFSNLIGMGLGPLGAGLLSDTVRPFAGDESLRWALLALTPGYFIAAAFAYAASRTVREDLRASTTQDPLRRAPSMPPLQADHLRSGG